MRSERSDHVPTQRLRSDHEGEHRPTEPRQERTRQKKHFRPGADEKTGVDCDEKRIVAAPVLASAPRQAPCHVAARDRKLREALGRGDGEQQEEQNLARHPPPVWRSRTSSEEKPGPMAMSSPAVPGGHFPSARVARSTNSAEALEMFPTSRRQRHVTSSSPSA